MLFGPVDGERPAIFEDEHDGLSGGDDGLEQLLLIAGESEAGAVESLAGDAVVFAESHDGDVGLIGGGDGLLNIGSLVEGDGGVGKKLANALKDGDAKSVGGVFVIAVARLVSIGADDGDSPDGFGERQQVVFVFEQGHGFAGRLKRDGEVGGRAVDLCVEGWIDVGVVKESELKLDAKDGAYGAIEV